MALLFITWCLLKGPTPTMRQTSSFRARRVAAEYHRRRLVTAMTVPEAQALLGVPADASKADILKAYQGLALRHHTDRGGENEMIVAINVAKDVLIKGKAIKFNRQENPETKQRDADLQTLLKLREQVVSAAAAARVGASQVSFGYKVNLRDYITGEMADICDAIEDTANEVAEDANHSELTRARAKKISAAVKVVLASAVKLATKYGAIFKNPLGTGSITYADAERAHKMLEKFIPALQATYKESKVLSGLLTTLVGTLEQEHNHPIPSDLADMYQSCQGMIRAFSMDYASVPTEGLARFEKAMESTHSEAAAILKRHGLESIAPNDWKQWKIPEDIDEAIESLRGLRRAASETR